MVGLEAAYLFASLFTSAGVDASQMLRTVGAMISCQQLELSSICQVDSVCCWLSLIKAEWKHQCVARQLPQSQACAWVVIAVADLDEALDD